MRELVGKCSECGKDIHCEDGFLNGIVNEDKTLCCFDCHEEQVENKDIASS